MGQPLVAEPTATPAAYTEPAYVQPAACSHWWAVQDAFGWDDPKLEFLPTGGKK